MRLNPAGLRTNSRAAFTLLGRAVDEVFLRVVDVAELDAETPWTPDAPDAYCHRCGATAGPGAAGRDGCPFCVRQSLAWDSLTRLGPYEAPLDERIRHMKFHGQWQWARWFGGRLAAALPADPSHPTLVVPVAMHWFRQWQRGFNQAHLLARAVGDARGWPVVDLLHRTRMTPPQTSVAPSQRIRNVRESVAAKPVDLTGRRVILVDDVKTSGATLTACARALRDRGAERVDVAVIAVADPRGHGFRTI